VNWEEFRSGAGVAANVTSLAFKFAALFKGKPTPELHLTVQATGGGTGVDFTAVLSETANRVPVMGVHFYAELDEEGVVYKHPPFNLAAGQIDRHINFAIARPRYGTLVKACNDATTLYGRTLTVTAVSDNGGAATATWHEDEYEPGSPRYEAMRAAWAEQGK
jgi:hypothetical protein